MIDIKPLAQLDPDDLQRLVTGYSSDAQYHVSKIESEKQCVITLELVPLAQPYLKRYGRLDAETLEHYRQVPSFGFSFGAYDLEQCVGIALTEPH